MAGVSDVSVSRLERGRLSGMALRTVRQVASVLGIQAQLRMWAPGGELDRLLNARHSALHESVARVFRQWPGWVLAAEVSFSIYGERGVIDLLAWHAASRSLLLIELKTAIVDIQELTGTLDRKRRLAVKIAAERGWDAVTVSVWLIVAEGSTNRRRVRAHGAMLRNTFPVDGRRMPSWLRTPRGSVSALTFWSDRHPQSRKYALARPERVRVPRMPMPERGSSVLPRGRQA